MPLWLQAAWSDAMAQASFHLPLVDSSRRSWEAWLAGHGGMVMGNALVEFRAVDGEYQGKESSRNEPRANPKAKSKTQERVAKAKEKLAKYRSENRGKPDFSKEEN